MIKKKRKERGKKYNNLLDILIRYLALFVAAIPNLWIFYFIFTPLTIYSVYLILGMFFKVSLMNNIILVNNLFPIEIIRACVAGSAYYLLLILNLSTPKIKLVKRIKMMSISFSAFFIFNILRIVLLSSIFINGLPLFNVIHAALWYFGSIVLVVLTWFIEVKLFRIKEIPFYSDLKTMLEIRKKSR